VGSGNGFPAVPLLLARSRLRGVLLEPRERRWAFLREVVRELGLATEVVRERVAEHARAGYSAVTVRGVEVGSGSRTPPACSARGDAALVDECANAEELALREPEGRVLTFPLPDPTRGRLAVWRRCFT